uniref:Uncharacterized protein n=1 Tax=Rhizophora mucronata TaxID=61149 RepID=A0A2P2M583_RHIMU
MTSECIRRVCWLPPVKIIGQSLSQFGAVLVCNICTLSTWTTLLGMCLVPQGGSAVFDTVEL